MIALLALLVALPACKTRPEGESRGRMGSTNTSDAEARSEKILPASLIEFSDQVVREMAARLSSIPRVRDADGRVTVIMGDVRNNTDIVSTRDFEMMLARIRTDLNTLPTTREKFRFVESRDRLRDIARREGVIANDGAVGPAAYNEEDTYVIKGEVFRIGRGNTNLYAMFMSLSHFASGEPVTEFRYEEKREAD